MFLCNSEYLLFQILLTICEQFYLSIKNKGYNLLRPNSESEVKSLSRVRLLATPWTAAHQAPLSLGFSRQEHWSGLIRMVLKCRVECM